MAENNSIYSRGGSGMTRGGLDRYLGPEAGDSSNVPMEIENAQITEAPIELDCAGSDKDEAVCQIAEAEKAKLAAKPSP